MLWPPPPSRQRLSAAKSAGTAEPLRLTGCWLSFCAWLQNYEPTLPPMLDAGIEVMIYAGVDDLICNWLGNYRWVNALPWNGAKVWAASNLRPWLVDGSVAGEVRQAQGLTFVKVAAAGHMVPMVCP